MCHGVRTGLDADESARVARVYVDVCNPAPAAQDLGRSSPARGRAEQTPCYDHACKDDHNAAPLQGGAMYGPGAAGMHAMIAK